MPRTMAPPPPTPPNARRHRRAFGVPALLLFAVLSALAVHVRSLTRPQLLHDDFPLLLDSRTWADTRDHLWVPMNEHAWPLTRLLVFAVGQIAGGVTWLPLVAMLSTRAALVGAMLLAYLFVRRERGHPLPGLLAAALFGVTAVYQEAVFWLAASPALWAVGTGLSALLAAQRWRQTGGWVNLTLAAVASALAPAWYAGGILVGPIVSVYLIGRPAGETPRGRWWAWLAGPLGAVAYLAVCLPLTGDRILHAAHYDGKTAVQAFDPLAAVVNTGRSLVDVLTVGAVGGGGFACPAWLSAVGVVVLAAPLAWWWRRAADRRLVLVGVATVLSSGLLVYGARAAWSYEEQLVRWSRYAVFPQLGVALVVAGGWRTNAAEFTRRQGTGVLVLVAVLALVQSPRGWVMSATAVPEQAAVFRTVDAVDRRCRELGVSAADARTVLPPEDVPLGEYDRWRFLQGSDAPRELTADERAGLRAALLPE